MFQTRRQSCRRAGLWLCAAALLAPGVVGAQVAAPAENQAAAQVPAPQAAEQVPISTVGVNLNITPRRLTLDRNRRSGTVYIFNQGTTPATFDISLVDRVMLPTGELRPVSDLASDPNHKPLLDRLKSAQGLVVAAPRRATLAPGKGQTIRIRANAPAGGADVPEYRTHLTVTTVPPRDTGLTAEAAANQQPGQLSFRVQSVFGLSIPVIVRSGPAEVGARIENVALGYADISPDGVAPAVRTPVLSFEMVRTGPNSLFGNVEISAAGEQEPIGLARGIGVYPEIDRRSIRIPLRRAPRAGEQLVIVYTDDDSKPGSEVARSTFTAP